MKNDQIRYHKGRRFDPLSDRSHTKTSITRSKRPWLAQSESSPTSDFEIPGTGEWYHEWLCECCCYMVWHDSVWYDMIWYDMIWCDVMWYDVIWYGMIWYDMIWYDMVWWYDYIIWFINKGKSLTHHQLLVYVFFLSLGTFWFLRRFREHSGPQMRDGMLTLASSVCLLAVVALWSARTCFAMCIWLNVLCCALVDARR